MNKQYTTINVNVPSDFLMDEKMTNMFIVADCTVINEAAFIHVIIRNMTFQGCTAFAIKPECIHKVVDLIEQLAIADVTRDEDDIDQYEHEMYYHELAGYGF